MSNGVLVVVGGGGWWVYNQSRITKEVNAAKALSLAKQSIGAQNSALAQSDLQKLVARYGGTGAGSEGAMLLAQLDYDQNKYQANLGNDESSIVITAAQAQALPPDFVAASLKKTADGGYTVPVSESTVGPFLQNETDAAARKAYYIAYNNRGGEANVPGERIVFPVVLGVHFAQRPS